MKNIFLSLRVLSCVLFVSSVAQADTMVDYLVAQNPHRALRAQPTAPVPTRDDFVRAVAGEMIVKKGDINGEGLRYVFAGQIMNVDAASYWLTIIDREHYDIISEKNIVESFIYEKVADDRFFTYNALIAPMVSTRHQVLNARINAELYAASGGRVWEHYWNLADNVAARVAHALTLNRLEKLTPNDLNSAVIIAHNDGSWILIPLPDGRVWAETYSVNDPGGKIPDFVVRKVSTMATADTLEAYETWAKKISSHIDGNHVDVAGPDGVWTSPTGMQSALANKLAALFAN